MADGLAGPLVVEPDTRSDARGWFREIYRASALAKLGLGQGAFVQENESRSGLGVVRGLHFQAAPHAQGKLVRCPAGRVFDVAVDVRPGSPTFGRWAGAELDADDGRMAWLPPGFAHGFQALTEGAVVSYLVTAEYAPGTERCVKWDDPAIGIRWPLPPGPLAPRDRDAPPLRDWLAQRPAQPRAQGRMG